MKRGIAETLLGALVLVAAAAFMVFAVRVAEIQTDGGYELTARFLKVGGLERGSDVRISGVKVGTVVDRRLDPTTFEAIVRFTVREDIRLPSDTQAGVTSTGLLGGKYIRLFPGRESDTLEAGAQLVQTRDFQSLEDTVSEIIFLATE